MERRFQFVRHVRGELASHLLRFFFFGYVENEKSDARHLFFGHYGTCVKSEISSADGDGDLRVFSRSRLPEHFLHFGGSVDGKNIFSETRVGRSENVRCGAVHAQDLSLFVQNDKTFAHICRCRFKLFPFPFKFFRLTFQLFLLCVHSLQQR